MHVATHDRYPMEYIHLKGTDFRVSRLGFGCGPLGEVDYGVVDRNQLKLTIYNALDHGINFFDTADIYGLGRAETSLSEILKSKIKDVVIITKVGVRWTSQKDKTGRVRTVRDSRPQYVVTALEASLRRLRIECIPIYLIHWPDIHTPIEETVEALIRCKKAGKIAHIGVSNFTAQQIRLAASAADGQLEVAEIGYNLVNKEVESETLSTCQDLGVNVVAYAPLAQGFLAGKYDTESDFEQNDCRSRLDHFQRKELQKNLPIISELKDISHKHKKTVAQTAIRWVLDHPLVASTIVSSKTVAQLEQNIGAVNWGLDEDDLRRLNNV